MDIRDKIISAYQEMVITHGFYRVSMDALAAKSGVSKRTIYRYFQSKEELIEAVIDKMLLLVGGKIDRVLSEAGTPEEAISGILNVLFSLGRGIINPLTISDLRTHYPHFWKKIDDFRMKRINLLIQAILRQNSGERIRNIDPRILTALVLSSVQTILNPEFIVSNNLDFDEAVNQLVEILKYGLLKED
ncbi:MAG: TetR/AcrR family transcriptional regulator [Clostridia bacterium]|jgi:AcrR family transcriptional regulator|nr:TetR/AcrR family transcriptional regulator [Clostridia bacterium]